MGSRGAPPNRNKLKTYYTHIYSKIMKGGAVMKNMKAVKQELKYTYKLDLALCVFNFLICSLLCAGGSEWLSIAGVIALVTAIIPIGFRRLYCKDEYTPRSVGAVMTVYRAVQIALLLYGIDYFLISGV